MDHADDIEELQRALRHCRAGVRALEAALEHVERSGNFYPTHLYVGAVELAAATETALAIGLRNQRPPSASASQNR